MDHLEAIVKINNMVSPELIEKIIPLIDKKCIKNMEVLSSLNKEIRNVKGHHLSNKDSVDIFYFNLIKKEIEKLYMYYKIKFPLMTSTLINQIDLLKYLPGGKYEIHTDHYTDMPRCLSVIINLNDNYEGGDLIFTDQKSKEIKRLKLGKGSIIFFPSNFMYPHSIQPITKGTRYSIVAWLQ
jgi:predicted 2-oxoglutarate/Fe(II)-dependent dioxygenase YbiX